MKRIVLVLALVIGIQGIATADPYMWTFNSSAGDWEYCYGYNGGTVVDATHVDTGGNPGGYISGSSASLYGVQNMSPSLSNVAGLTMTMDTMITDSESGTAQFYVGRSGTYYVDGTWSIGLDTGWTTHTTVLNSSNFTLWPVGPANTLAYVLAAPDDIGIFFGGGNASGTGTLDVDNFGVVPIPAAVLLGMLGLGAAGVKLRKFA